MGTGGTEMAGFKDAFLEARANRRKRSPLQVGLSTGALICAIVICVLLMRHFKPDQMLILLFPVLIIGIMFTIHTVRNNSRNKADVTDEHETCMPILDKYNEKHDVRRLMRDYKEWWEGDHSNYTRMHFAAKIIDILQDNKRYEKALEVLYQVAGLPLKGRDHYDFDKYLNQVEPILKEGLAKQKKLQGKQLA